MIQSLTSSENLTSKSMWYQLQYTENDGLGCRKNNAYITFGYRQLNVRQLGSLCPWDHRGKCYMDRKRIQCLSNASQHVPIYLQPLTGFWQFSWANERF